MKKCSIQGCEASATKRGITCSPQHAQMLRDGVTQLGPTGDKETHEVKENSWSVSLDATRICTLEQLIEHCKVDTRIWEVERFVANKWEVGAKVNEKLQASPLYQVKAWFKKKPGIAFAIQELADLKAATEIAPRFESIIRDCSVRVSKNIAEISLPDIHIGKLAWGKETGAADYDVKIAIASYSDAIDALLHRVSGTPLDQIVFVVGNDLFHVDNRGNMTTKGTPQDVDSRYHKVFKKVRELIVRKIEEMRMVAPVRVVVVPGNHDEQSAWHLGDSLECWFRSCGDVEIDNDPTPRKYFQFGKCMIMWTHGDKGKKNDYPLVMATEKPAMFGATIYREAHIGHEHTTRTNEFHGVKVRTLPSLSGTDYWHSSNGYTGNIRTGELTVWNASEGPIITAFYTIPDKDKAA